MRNLTALVMLACFGCSSAPGEAPRTAMCDWTIQSAELVPVRITTWVDGDLVDEALLPPQGCLKITTNLGTNYLFKVRPIFSEKALDK